MRPTCAGANGLQRYHCITVWPVVGPGLSGPSPCGALAFSMATAHSSRGGETPRRLLLPARAVHLAGNHPELPAPDTGSQL